MPVSLGSAVTYIAGDRSPFRDELAKAEGDAKGWVSRVGGSLQSGLTRAFKIGGAAAVAGIGALGAGMAAAAVDGLRLNSSLENVEAQLNAFTKDATLSKQILADIREEASKTPFAFNEMATATAGLLPVARASGEELMSLVRTAEILAASNPAEGLKGAAFALREAASGDFTSAIERFNLPRQYINQLKEEGVPALEIVRRAMLQMGYDADLVSNLATTFTGRWSTFMDTLRSIPQRATGKLFEHLSNGLGRVQELLDANAEGINAWADQLGEAIGERAGRLIDDLTHRVQVFQAAGGGALGLLAALGLDPEQGDRVIHSLFRLRSGLSSLFEIGRMLLTGDFRGGIFGWMEDDGRITALLRFRSAVLNVFGLIRDSFITFQQALTGDWEDDTIIHPLHRIIGRLGTFVGEVWTKAQEVAAAFGEDGWRGALRELVPPEWASVIEGAVTKLDELRTAVLDRIEEVRAALGEGGWRGLLKNMLPEGIAERVAGVASAFGALTLRVGEFLAHDPQGVIDLLLGISAALLTFKTGMAAVAVTGAVTAALGAMSAAIAGGGGVMGALTALVALLGGPVTIAIGLVAAAVGLLVVAWRRDWGNIQQAVTDAWFGHIGPLTERIRTTFTTTIPQALAILRTMWRAAWDYMAGDLRRSYNNYIKPILDAVTAGVNAVRQSMEWLNSVNPLNRPAAPGGSGGGGTKFGATQAAPAPVSRVNPLPMDATQRSVTVPVTINGNMSPDASERRRIIEEAKRELEAGLLRAWDGAAGAGTRRPLGTALRP